MRINQCRTITKSGTTARGSIDLVALTSLAGHGYITVTRLALDVVILQGDLCAVGVFELEIRARVLDHDVIE